MRTIIAVLILLILTGCTQQPQQVQIQDPVPLIMKHHSPYDAPRYAGHATKEDINNLKPQYKYVLRVLK